MTQKTALLLEIESCFLESGSWSNSDNGKNSVKTAFSIDDVCCSMALRAQARR